MRRSLLALAAVLLSAAPVLAQEVGEIGTDWLGNEIKIEAVADPKIQGITCHVSYFDRGVVDRLRQGNWFEDPSNSSIACRQTGPITVGDIDLGKDGEEIFSARRSLVFKSLKVNRVYDKANDTLIYLTFAREISEGSAKMAISTVPLFSANATWEKGRPQ
jgi:CreA protein